MSGEQLGFNGGMDTARASAWDTMAELNKEHPDSKREAPEGLSNSFRKQAAEYREIGEEMAPQVTKAAMESIGARDGQDLGEFLHERALWQEQVDEAAVSLDADILYRDDMIGEFSLDGKPFREIIDQDAASPEEEMRKERFLNSCGDTILDNYPTKNGTPVPLLPTLIHLSTDREVVLSNPNGRDTHSLLADGAKLWLDVIRDNPESLERAKKSPTFKLVERAIAVREAVKDGTYEPMVNSRDELGNIEKHYEHVPMREVDSFKERQHVDNFPAANAPEVVDIRDSRLYQAVDKLMTEYEKQDA